MKSLNLFLIVLLGVVSVAVAGPERFSGKELKQVQSVPCPEWYGDKEWNVSIWGAYAFTETESNRSRIEQADDQNIFGTYDRFLGGDHAWGGGIEVKYFFSTAILGSGWKDSPWLAEAPARCLIMGPIPPTRNFIPKIDILWAPF